MATTADQVSKKYGHSTAYLNTDLKSQSITDNSSVVRVFGYSNRDSGWGGTAYNAGVGWTLKSPDFADKSGTKAFNTTGNVTWFDYTFTVKHESDGSCILNVDMHVNGTGTSTFGGPIDLSLDRILPTIPRTSSPSVSGAVDAGSKLTISTNRKSSSFTHTLTYKFGSASGTIATGVGASYAWTVPMSLLNQIPNATSGSGTITCTTYSGSTKIGSDTVGFTVRAGSSVVPTISSTSVSEVNSNVASKIGAFVQGESALKLTTSASGTYGSTIKSSTVTIAGYTVNSGGSTGTITQSGTLTLTATVRDSRGRTTSKTGTVSVLAYSPPRASSVKFRRATSSGTVSEDGTVVRVDATSTVSSLKVGSTEKNTTLWKLEYREVGGTWGTIGSWAGTVPTTTAGKWGGTVPATESRETRLTISDALNSVVIGGVISTQKVALALAKCAAGIGKVWEQGVLDVAGQIYQAGQKVIDNTMNPRHVTDSASGTNERAYFGTGPAGAIRTPGSTPGATGDGGTYIGMATTTDPNADAIWFTHDGSTKATIRKNGDFNIGGNRMQATHYPFAIASGSVTFTGLTSGVRYTKTITFPSGRFSVTPNITIGSNTTYPGNVSATYATPTATGMTIYVQRTDSVTDLTVTWTAIQASSASANG